MFSCIYSRKKNVAKFLINAGADVLIPAKNGCTAFDMASLIGMMASLIGMILNTKGPYTLPRVALAVSFSCVSQKLFTPSVDLPVSAPEKWTARCGWNEKELNPLSQRQLAELKLWVVYIKHSLHVSLRVVGTDSQRVVGTDSQQAGFSCLWVARLLTLGDVILLYREINH